MIKQASKLAKKMREFRAITEETAYSEGNGNEDNDRKEVIKQINWTSFNEVIDQLEFYEKNKN